MGGLLVLALIGLYSFISYKLVRLIPPRWGRGLAVLVLVLLPTVDAVYGRFKLKEMCKAEGGLKIIRTVDGVEGFYAGDHRPGREWLTRYGFKFVEGRGVGKVPMRLHMEGGGQIVEEKGVALKSRYAYEQSGGASGGGYSWDEMRIRDLETKEVLARNLNFSYEGGWVERLIGRISDAGGGFAGACQEASAQMSPTKIVAATLKTNPTTLKKQP